MVYGLIYCGFQPISIQGWNHPALNDLVCQSNHECTQVRYSCQREVIRRWNVYLVLYKITLKSCTDYLKLVISA